MQEEPIYLGRECLVLGRQGLALQDAREVCWIAQKKVFVLLLVKVILSLAIWEWESHFCAHGLQEVTQLPGPHQARFPDTSFWVDNCKQRRARSRQVSGKSPPPSGPKEAKQLAQKNKFLSADSHGLLFVCLVAKLWEHVWNWLVWIRKSSPGSFLGLATFVQRPPDWFSLSQRANSLFLGGQKGVLGQQRMKLRDHLSLLISPWRFFWYH